MLVHIHNLGPLGARDEYGELGRPLGHERHGDPVQHRPASSFKEVTRPGMVIGEPSTFPIKQVCYLCLVHTGRVHRTSSLLTIQSTRPPLSITFRLAQDYFASLSITFRLAQDYFASWYVSATHASTRSGVIGNTVGRAPTASAIA